MQVIKRLTNQSSKSETKKRPLRRAIGYLGQYRRMTFLAYGALFIATVAQLAVPELIQNMINTVTNGIIAKQVLTMPETIQGQALDRLGLTMQQVQNNANNAETLLVSAVILILLFAIMRGLFAFVQAYMAEWTSQGIAYTLRNDIFSKIQRLSFSYYDRNQTGQLMIRATDDVERVRAFIAQGLILAVQAILLLVLTLSILFLTNWRLTLVVVGTLPFAFVLFMVFGRLAQPLFNEVQKRLSNLNTILQENVAGIKVVKAFVRQNYEQKRFRAANDDLYHQWMRVASIFSVLFPLIFLVGQLGQAAVLYFAGDQILNGTLMIGEYQKFSLYLVYAFFPLGQLGIIISLMAQAAASSERIFEILDAQSDVVDKPDAITLPPIRGEVEFRNVSFAYFNSKDYVLKDVNFVAKPGQTIALLGSTGSGKTTIINLIPRFYDVTEGCVLIDGYDVRDVKQDSLRSQIGIVLQETNLFSGTIRDNIAFGRPDATDDEVIEAAKAAAAHDFIMEFPQGYDTPVGERGATLSGGQKQRIAIARALLLKPNILILDDSTSSVDFATERKIQNALDNLMKGQTSFVIAQRISTARNADQIIVLDKGRVAAIGTHETLIETSPIYAEIYTSQLVDDAVPQEA
ncbi:MAG: ABC transporter ATP-binding protein [Phototrophicales bacterium]|nr:MAG: ABC transporter ATP-binding protein [Phototrophicales bacterium]RMG71119.1 MAG: ABC transporter ATP-binding protein [Chloroflexota bacterium]